MSDGVLRLPELVAGDGEDPARRAEPGGSGSSAGRRRIWARAGLPWAPRAGAVGRRERRRLG